MTNAYFDQEQPATPYRGGFKICSNCVTVIPIAYEDRHEHECKLRGKAVDRLDAIELEQQEQHPAIEVEDVTQWDDATS